MPKNMLGSLLWQTADGQGDYYEPQEGTFRGKGNVLGLDLDGGYTGG